jgi:hypothetical protein
MKDVKDFEKALKAETKRHVKAMAALQKRFFKSFGQKPKRRVR